MIGQYLMFNRNCIEALEIYEKAFDTKIVDIQRYGDMPPNQDFPIAETDKALVLHARLNINNVDIMCADTVEQLEYGTNMFVSITTPDTAFVKKAWDILKEGGEVYMDLTPSFFANLHGSLQDRFGINWMFTASK